jgi:hypothetical protein
MIYQVEEQEVAVELIGREENQRILFWEAAEGGIGLWERLVSEKDAFAGLAYCAISIIHGYASTGADVLGWTDRCTAACYDCLLSYSNQPDHRHLNRKLIKEYLLKLAQAKLAAAGDGRTFEEHYRWLCEQVDPTSTLERRFLDYLYQERLRLPDHAQHRPSEDVAAQPDFYYERDGIPGICIFVDGSHHAYPEQLERDWKIRAALQDQGYRVVSIVHSRPLSDQVREHWDVFARA